MLRAIVSTLYSEGKPLRVQQGLASDRELWAWSQPLLDALTLRIHVRLDAI